MVAKPLKWLTGLLGGREIDKRVEEDFPSWEEFSKQKIRAAELEKSGLPVDLPAHQVHISSPLQWNFLYFLVVTGSLAMGYARPDWAPMFVYSAILLVFLASLVVIARDGIFFHFEGQRLEEDGEMINRYAGGPEQEPEPEPSGGFLQSLTGKKKSLFRSKLFQIHYQNVLRTFEQGSRRAWVNQESSITDLHTLLTQRGMKLVWTFIEVLPQLGLLGTLIGLARMFLAFSASAAVPETSIIAGFGTALGTTILANLFVLILRPLFMRNERSMNEILSTLQMLMAMFILPTQQHVLERPGVSGGPRPARAAPGLALLEQGASGGLSKSLDDLTHALEHYAHANPPRERGGRETIDVTEEVKATLLAFKETGGGDGGHHQQAALSELAESVQGLTSKIDSWIAQDRQAGAGAAKNLEHDLMQMRLMTHDTLVLIEQVADRLGKKEEIQGKLLSKNPALRSRVFPEHGEGGPSAPGNPLGSGPGTGRKKQRG